MLRLVFSGMFYLIGMAVFLSADSKPSNTAPAVPSLRTQVRRPVAMALVGEQLVIGNRNSGSLTVIDANHGKVLAEHDITRCLSDLVSLGNSSGLLVLDEETRQLLKVALKQGTPKVTTLIHLPVAGFKLVYDASRNTVFVSAKWSHRLLRLSLDARTDSVTKLQVLELPFAPLELLLLPQDNYLLVAEAFGHRLAVLDRTTGELRGLHELNGHNIRGLAVSEDGRHVLVAQQVIPDKARVTYDEVHWGRLVDNAVEVVAVAELLKGENQPLKQGWVNSFGGIGNATADPSGVLTGPNGLMAVAFSGIGEVSVRYRGSTRRLPVGRHPEAMAASNERLFVANRLDDSITVIDLPSGEVTQTVSLGPRPELTAEQRGERLFFDAKLSHDGWMSCHSCHTEGHTAGLVVDTLGDGDYGAPKLVPSLLGVRDTQPWGWDGSAALLREQVQKSITTTLHGEPLGVRDMEDLFAYLSSLEPPPPQAVASRKRLEQGRAVFESRGCINCHTPPAYTIPETVEIDLQDESRRNRFNPPSLRGVGQRRRYFHDGRAYSLEDVLQKVRHQLDEPLNPNDTAALLVFLRSL